MRIPREGSLLSAVSRGMRSGAADSSTSCGGGVWDMTINRLLGTPNCLRRRDVPCLVLTRSTRAA
jgi:hypothetical protein